MANDKVFSVRADDETIAKLDKIAEESGMKKAELLPALLGAYASQQAKGALPGRRTEIENVENLLTQIKNAYLASLELNANAEARIRDEFAARLQSNEQAVASLKEQAEQSKTDARNAQAVLKATEERADAEAKRADDAEEALGKNIRESKERESRLLKFNASLESQVDTLKQKVDANASDLEAAAALESENAKLKNDLVVSNERVEKAEKEAANLKQQLADATKKAKDDALELKGRYDEKYENLREKMTNEKDAAVLKEHQKVMGEMQKQVDKVQKKYETLLLALEKKVPESAQPAKRGRPKKAEKVESAETIGSDESAKNKNERNDD